MPIVTLSPSHSHPKTGEVRLRFVDVDSGHPKKRARRLRTVEMSAIVKGTPDAVWIQHDLTVVFLKEGAPLLHSDLRTAVTYERQNKTPKVLAQVAATENVYATCPNHILCAYDMLFAIDTNTIEIGGVSVSVSCCTQFSLERDGNCVQMRGFNTTCFEFNGVRDAPENYAWRELVKTIQSSPGYADAKRIAIVVDSDLRCLGAFNAREKSIYEDFYLPVNMVLVYASSEVGTTEYAANGIMKFCDGQAKQLLKLRKTRELEVLPPGHFRTYKHKDNFRDVMA